MDMEHRITRPIRRKFQVEKQSDVILFGLPGLNCRGLAYQINIEITPILKSTGSSVQGKHGINKTVDTLPILKITQLNSTQPLPALNICARCRDCFHETEELVKHLKSHCGNNDVVRERHVNAPCQAVCRNHQLINIANQMQTNNASTGTGTGAAVQRRHQPSLAVGNRPSRPQQQPIPQTRVAATATRTTVVRDAGQLQSSTVVPAPWKPLPGSSRYNDRNRNNQKKTARQRPNVPPVYVSRNNDRASVFRTQLKSKKRSNNLMQPTEQEKENVPAKLIEIPPAVRVPSGSSIRASLPIIDQSQDLARYRSRARRRNQQPRNPNPNNNVNNESQPTSSQFSCKIPGCTNTFDTITELTDHTILDHDLEHRRYWELNPKPKCFVCDAVTEDFKKIPTEFFRHVFECKRGKKEQDPDWNPRLSKIKHLMPLNRDEAMWYFQVHNYLQGKRTTQGQIRKRARPASVTGLTGLTALSSGNGAKRTASDRVLRSRSDENRDRLLPDEIVLDDSWSQQDVPIIRSEIVGKAGGQFVKGNELKSVIGNNWLQSSVIDTFAAILQERILNKGFHYIPTTALQKFQNKWQTAESARDRMLQSVLEKQFIATVATIINVGDHWLLIVARFETQEIGIIDTLPSESSLEVVHSAVDKLITDILEIAFGVVSWKIGLVPNISEQTDSHSCGPGSLFYLEKVMRGKNLSELRPQLYRKYRSKIIRKILSTTTEGKGILKSENEFTKYLKRQQQDQDRTYIIVT